MAGLELMDRRQPLDERSSRLGYRRYWLALYRRDVAEAERVVNDCLRQWPPQRLYTRLFEPALNLSGSMWADNRISYRDEHFVTHHTLRLMRRVRREFVPGNPTGPLALATGIWQNSHLIGLRMVCDFLQSANWRTSWLPSNDRGVVRRCVTDLRPAALLLSIGLITGIEPAARLTRTLRRDGFGGLIIVGGGAINTDPSLVSRIGADLTARNGRHLLRQLREGVGGISLDGVIP